MLLRKQRKEFMALLEENARLKALLEEKRRQEIEERLRLEQMQNFWAYDGTPQGGDGV